MRTAQLWIATLALVTACLPGTALATGGDLAVTPLRVIFRDGGAREDTVSLVNSGQEPGTYRLSFLHYAQTRKDGLVEVTRATDRPDILFADKLLRVSPESVNLPPQVAQAVRIQSRIPPNLPRGEYRTHLAFTSLPEPMKPRSLQTKSDRRPVRLAISTAFRLAIPIVIWNGDLKADVVLRELAFTRAGRTGEQEGILTFTIFRSGERSVFGNITISFLPYRELEPVEIGRMTDVAIYHPNELRDMIVPVVFPKELRGKKGQLVLTFFDPNQTPMIRHEASVEVQ